MLARMRMTRTKTTPHDPSQWQNLYPSGHTMNSQTSNVTITPQILETERTATTPQNTTSPHHRDNRSSDVSIIRLPAHTVSAEIQSQIYRSPPIVDIFITRDVPLLHVYPNNQKKNASSQRQHASPQRSDCNVLEKWSRTEFVNQLALNLWRQQRSCWCEQTKWNTSLHMTKICGRTACRSHKCLCWILRSRTIFDLATKTNCLTTKTNCRHTAWTAPQMCPSSVLRRKRLPQNFRKTCHLCASHHVTMTLWSKTSVAEFQLPTKPTIWCFVHVDNSVEVKTKTTTHNQNLPAKSKSVGGTIPLVPPSSIVEIARNPRPDDKKKNAATHHQLTTTDTFIPLPHTKIGTLDEWTKKMSPPTLHILITGTIHHVCTRRTPWSTRDNTDNADDSEQSRWATTLYHHTARTAHQLWTPSTFQRTRFLQKSNQKTTNHFSHWKSQTRMAQHTTFR